MSWMQGHRLVGRAWRGRFSSLRRRILARTNGSPRLFRPRLGGVHCVRIVHDRLGSVCRLVVDRPSGLLGQFLLAEELAVGFVVKVYLAVGFSVAVGVTSWRCHLRARSHPSRGLRGLLPADPGAGPGRRRALARLWGGCRGVAARGMRQAGGVPATQGCAFPLLRAFSRARVMRSRRPPS